MALNLLSRLTRIEGGDMKRVLTRERMNALQDLVLALWRGENITTTGSVRRTLGMAGVRIDGRAVAGSERGEIGVPACPFGEIIPIPGSDPPAIGIRGGVVHCGNQNWDFTPYQIDLETAFDKVLWLSVACTVNQDDDGEVLLPGIVTGTEPLTWSDGVDYPPNSQPAAAAPAATVILPIGRLVVTLPEDAPVGTKGTANLSATGCGTFTVTHCAGLIGYSRG